MKKSLEDAHRWQEAQLFRQYISRVKALAAETETLTDELNAWINWAEKKADWLDPLVNSPDSLMNEYEPGSFLFVSHSLTGSA